MAKLIKSTNLVYKSQPVIWLESDFVENVDGKNRKKAILVAVWGNKTTKYSIQHLSETSKTNKANKTNINKLKKSFNEILTTYAPTKKISLEKPLVKSISSEEVSACQQYFKETLPVFMTDTLIIEDLDLVKTILASFTEVTNTKDIILASEPFKNSSSTVIKTPPQVNRAQHFSTPLSSYGRMAFDLATPPLNKPTYTEFNGLNGQWQKMDNNNKVKFESKDSDQISKMAIQIYKKLFDPKAKKTGSQDFDKEYKAMIHESSANSLVCSENMMTALFGIKTYHYENFLQMRNQNLLEQQKEYLKKEQELLLKTFEKNPVKLTPECLRMAEHQKTIYKSNNYIPIFYKFEEMKYSTHWSPGNNSKLFTIVNETEGNEICLEIVNKIEKTYISAIDAERQISAIAQSSQRFKDKLKLEVDFHLLQSLFGQPKISSIKTETIEQNNNTVKKLTPELFRTTILEKLFEELKVFNKDQQFELLCKICNRNDNSIESLYSYISINVIEGDLQKVTDSVTTLRGLISGTYKSPIQFDTQDIITETYDFLSSKINQLEKDLKQEQFYELLQKKFNENDKDLIVTQPFSTEKSQDHSETNYYNSGNKRKLEDYESEKIAHRKLNEYKAAFTNTMNFTSDFQNKSQEKSLVDYSMQGDEKVENSEDFLKTILI